MCGGGREYCLILDMENCGAGMGVVVLVRTSAVCHMWTNVEWELILSQERFLHLSKEVWVCWCFIPLHVVLSSNHREALLDKDSEISSLLEKLRVREAEISRIREEEAQRASFLQNAIMTYVQGSPLSSFIPKKWAISPEGSCPNFHKQESQNEDCGQFVRHAGYPRFWLVSLRACNFALDITWAWAVIPGLEVVIETIFMVYGQSQPCWNLKAMF